MTEHPKIKTVDTEQFGIEHVDNTAHGSFNKVDRVLFRVAGPVREHIIRLVKRTRTEGPLGDKSLLQLPDAEAENAMRLRLKEAGVPIIPTYRVQKGSDPADPVIYATDLTAGPGGKKQFVISFTNTPFDGELIRENIASGAYDVPVESKDEIAEQIRSIARSCADDGIRIKNKDGIYVLIDEETRETRLIAGDYKHFEDTDEDTETLYRKNFAELRFLFKNFELKKILGLTDEDYEKLQL